jgi:hypothetical protein
MVHRLSSFIVIGGHHHHVMRYAERSDARLRTLNMLWLLTIVLNPFPDQGGLAALDRRPCPGGADLRAPSGPPEPEAAVIGTCPT